MSLCAIPKELYETNEPNAEDVKMANGIWTQMLMQLRRIGRTFPITISLYVEVGQFDAYGNPLKMTKTIPLPKKARAILAQAMARENANCNCGFKLDFDAREEFLLINVRMAEEPTTDVQAK